MQEATVPTKTKREQEEEMTPIWIKIFGGSVLSIAFLSVITICSYFISNLNNLQLQVNDININSAQKRDIAEIGSALISCKERLNSIEQLAKERLIWMDKYENRIGGIEKSIETLNKDYAAQKERLSLLEVQETQHREENKQLVKDLQTLRERVAVLEGKKPQ